MAEQIRIRDVVLSVDNEEWYYGKRENVNDRSKKILVKEPVSENNIVSVAHVKEINDIFRWIESHERDSAKKKKRPLYVDECFFVTHAQR